MIMMAVVTKVPWQVGGGGGVVMWFITLKMNTNRSRVSQSRLHEWSTERCLFQFFVCFVMVSFFFGHLSLPLLLTNITACVWKVCMRSGKANEVYGFFSKVDGWFDGGERLVGGVAVCLKEAQTWEGQDRRAKERQSCNVLWEFPSRSLWPLFTPSWTSLRPLPPSC